MYPLQNEFSLRFPDVIFFMAQLKVCYTIILSPTTTQNPSIWCCQVEIEKGICVFENSKQNYMRQILKWHYRKHKRKWIEAHISIKMFNVTGILMPTGYDDKRNEFSSFQNECSSNLLSLRMSYILTMLYVIIYSV